MSVLVLAYVLALAFGIAEEIQASGRSLVGWGLIILAAALLWSHLG